MNATTIATTVKVRAQAPHTHFELGFSVNAIATLGRKAMEQQGGKVS